MSDKTTLEEVRTQWEKGCTPLLTVPVVIGQFGKLLVVLSEKTPGTKNAVTYRLHRYFPIGGNWGCSVDVSAAKTVEQVFEMINTDRDVSDLMNTLGTIA